MSTPADQDLVAADVAVRQLYARYADAVWRKDTAAFLACFTGDATWKISGQVAQGRKAIGSFFDKSLALSERVMFWAGPPAIDIADGVVTARLQVTEMIRRKDGAYRTLGLYYDRFASENGALRIAWHHFDMAYFGPPDLSGAYIEGPDYGPPPGFPPDDAPTTVRH